MTRNLSLLDIVDLAIVGLFELAKSEEPLTDGRRYYYEARHAELWEIRKALSRIERDKTNPT